MTSQAGITAGAEQQNYKGGAAEYSKAHGEENQIQSLPPAKQFGDIKTQEQQLPLAGNNMNRRSTS